MGEGSLKALDRQEGGNHYKKYPIQPFELMYMYECTPAIGTALKYILRYRDKNGLEDLKKAVHCIEIAMEMEYPEQEGPG